MADRWMDDRERRERDDRERRNPQRALGGGRYAEDRSFDRDDDPSDYRGDGGYEGGREAVFGERESGANYGSHIGGPSGYRSGGADRDRPGWQNPGYSGVSPAMRRGGGYGRGRFQGEDYTRRDYGREFGGAGGGRYYGDDAREPVYREEWSQGRRDYGPAPRGYDAGYSETRDRYHSQGYGQPGYEGDDDRDSRRSREFSGGTGGYDYERGYGDAGRSQDRTGDDRGQRFEDAGRGAGEFLHRAGQRVAEWFGGGGEARAYDRSYDRGARGMGPKGYKRSDERISEDAHERLTDDGWLDASNISVSVSGGELTLSGTVESREAKHRAERIVEDISGVAHVQNNLRIQQANFLRNDSTGYGDTVAEAQRRESPVATSTTGEGAGQSTAGKKN